MRRILGARHHLVSRSTALRLYRGRGLVISINIPTIVFAHPSASSSLITLVLALIVPWSTAITLGQDYGQSAP
jgi:hypothetical protein